MNLEEQTGYDPFTHKPYVRKAPPDTPCIPWRMEIEEKKYFDSQTGEPKYDRMTWLFEGNERIALLAWGLSETDETAIATKMAAAPDLLAACEFALMSVMVEDFSERDALKQVLHNAIMKARGLACPQPST